jgi:hypothetical protein
MRKPIQFLAISIPALLLLAAILYFWPAIQSKLGWRLEALWADIHYALNPPEQAVFIPSTPETEGVPPTLLPTTPPQPTATLSLFTVEPTTPPTPSPLPTMTPTPLPTQAALTGILHQYQMWNNCGPANLAMGLSFWGWKGDQRDTAAYLKPNERDKNVMPYEMEAFVEQETGLEAVVRVGGEPEMIKAFISAGFPVIAEKGFEGVGFDGWMGHYQVVSGYDDAEGVFIVQDSYKGPDLPISYDDFASQWRAFNNTYLVVYPPERREQVLQILGLQAYDNFNNHYAAQKAGEETTSLTGRDLYFAWFNSGSNLVALQDYTAAAQAYDTAFANYPQIPEEARPWRMMWYQTGPYFAYYYTGRYQDVINLATQTLEAMSEPILEESYYWRARAYSALGKYEEALSDLNQCLEVHEGFAPCEEELQKLGVEP